MTGKTGKRTITANTGHRRAADEHRARLDAYARGLDRGYADYAEYQADVRAQQKAKLRQAKAVLKQAREHDARGERPTLDRAIKGDFRAVWPGDADAWKVGVTGALRDMGASPVLELVDKGAIGQVHALAAWRFGELAEAMFGRERIAQMRYEERTDRGVAGEARDQAGLLQAWRAMAGELLPEELAVLDYLIRLSRTRSETGRAVFRGVYGTHQHALNAVVTNTLITALKRLVKFWGWTDPKKVG